MASTIFFTVVTVLLFVVNTQGANENVHAELQLLQAQLNQLHRQLQMTGDHDHGDMDHGDGDMDHGDGNMDNGDGNMDNGDGDMTGGDHDHGSEDHSDHGAGVGGHPLFFTTGDDTTVLFEGWTTDNTGEYIGSCLFVIFLGILLEAITTFRMVYPNHKIDFSTAGFIAAHTPRTNAAGAASVDSKPVNVGPTWRVHAVKTILYLIGITIAYFLMLIIMTFNVGLFISAVLGLTIGFFIFGMARSRTGSNENDSAECCHNIA